MSEATKQHGPQVRTDDSAAVPPGLKWIEQVVIPSEWDNKRLGDHVRYLNKGTNSRAELVDDGPIKYLHYGDIHTTTEVQLSPLTQGMPSLPAERALTLDRLRDGDLVFVDASEDLDGIGKSVEITCTSDTEIVAGLHTIAARFDKSILVDGFKAYLQFCPAFRHHLRRLAAGTKVYATNRAHISSAQVPLPPPSEQRAIAEALSDVDGLLAALEVLIAKKRAIKQAAMQQLLTGKTRLPGFSGSWETRRIGDFADCTAGGTPATSVAAYWGGRIRWMSSGELNLKRIEEVAGRITEAGLANSSAKLLPARCVLIGLAGQGKTRGTVAVNLVELSTNQSIAAVLPNQSFVPEYLYFSLDDRYEELRELSSGGGGRGGLNLKLIKSLVVPFPQVNEQLVIATVLSDMDAEITALERRLDKTRAIMQGMMQQLLTGRVRLIAPDQRESGR